MIKIQFVDGLEITEENIIIQPMLSKKNIKSEFVKWKRSSETWDTERDKEFFELYKVADSYCYDLEGNYYIDINVDSIPL